MELLVVVALMLAGIALSRTSAAERRLRDVTRRLVALEAGVKLSGEPDAAPSGVPVDGVLPSPVIPTRPPIWPEDVMPALPPPLPALRTSRGPSLWAPEFSRARISVAGGLLVLGGLAFTLRALGAPAWTLLLAVFAFGALLYFNARRVPWPVSGALRGLGYGVAALGVGSLSQRLPEAWGPAAVLGGLLLLSAALLWDASRRREPLLGALAVSGAALSTWMLTDDLGRASIPAVGLTLLLAGAAVWWGRAPGVTERAPTWPEVERERQAAQRAALPLTLAVAGTVPLGWLVASIHHVPLRRWFDPMQGLAAALQVDTGVPALWPWLLFSVLALSVPLALLARPAQGDPEQADPGPEATAEPAALGAAWATLIPQALVALAVGAVLSTAANRGAEVACALGILLAVSVAARLAWRPPGNRDSGALEGAVRGGLTAGAAGIAGSLAVSVLGPRTEALALSGIAAALLLVGLYGRSRFWLRVGALGLAGAAALGTARALDASLWTGQPWTGLPWAGWPPVRSDVGAALLGAAPAVLAVLAALRLGPVDGMKAGLSRSRWTAPLLAGLGSAGIGGSLLAGGSVLVWLWCAIAALGLVWLTRTRSTLAPLPGLVGVLAGAPGLGVGALELLRTHTGLEALLGVSAALLAGGALYGASRVLEIPAAGTLASLSQLASLAFVVGGLSRTASIFWPAMGTPGALALTALLSVPLRWRWSWSRRLDTLLGLGVLALLGVVGSGPDTPQAVPVVGALLLLCTWALTRTATGLAWLNRVGRDLCPEAAPQSATGRTYWGAGLLALTLLTIGDRLGGAGATLRPWLVLSSLSALLVGLHACLQAHRAGGGAARRWWNAGLTVIVLAGIKSAGLDVWRWPNPPAALGIAVLVTGLSLLTVAILAPRPGEPALPPDEVPPGGDLTDP
ncbi:hypothetical protein E7T09_10055 [Deinococcus sp. KSM4-11]|uniref:hypothetical protein n=1 Tax=Deinococcus sp. KSM4-11 TaxID=2568654 RepID=UPI0010A4E36E|nr:hypothetical protein [Deinococcus sp. KSM4-11]THF86461.1 hypothetical protein E7T09_10055 [Deinococcus sp. KSM4-11]